MLVGKSVTDHTPYTSRGAILNFPTFGGKIQTWSSPLRANVDLYVIRPYERRRVYSWTKVPHIHTQTNHSLRHAPPPSLPVLTLTLNDDINCSNSTSRHHTRNPGWKNICDQPKLVTLLPSDPSHDIRIQPPSLSCVFPRWKQLGQLLLLLTAL